MNNRTNDPRAFNGYINSVRDDSRWQNEPLLVFDLKIQNLIGQVECIPFRNSFDIKNLPEALNVFSKSVKNSKSLLTEQEECDCHERLVDVAKKHLTGKEYIEARYLLHLNRPNGAESPRDEEIDEMRDSAKNMNDGHEKITAFLHINAMAENLRHRGANFKPHKATQEIFGYGFIEGQPENPSQEEIDLFREMSGGKWFRIHLDPDELFYADDKVQFSPRDPSGKELESQEADPITLYEDGEEIHTFQAVLHESLFDSDGNVHIRIQQRSHQLNHASPVHCQFEDPKSPSGGALERFFLAPGNSHRQVTVSR